MEKSKGTSPQGVPAKRTQRTSCTPRAPKLSPRLQKLHDLVQGGGVIWDVGTDHGRLPVSLIISGGASFAVASDINRGPIESAKATARKFEAEDRMEFRLCDGLSGEIPNGLTTVIIAGLGGETIFDICVAAPWIIDKGIHLLLQPMTQIDKLRKYIYSGDYKVLGEHLVREKGRVYLIMEIMGGGSEEDFTFLDTRIGKYTVRDEPYKDYLVRERKRIEKELNGADANMETTMRSAISDIDKIING